MSLSSSIRFTKTSTALQDFINNLPDQHIPLSPPLVATHLHKHRSLLNTLRDHTAQWHKQFKGTQLSNTCPSFPNLTTLSAPSKLYVLHRVLTGTDAVSKCACRRLVDEAPMTATLQAELVYRLNCLFRTKQRPSTKRQHRPRKPSALCSPDMQWFHVNTHEQLLALTDREMMTMLDDMDDAHVHNALQRWRHFPDLYDYFVPLNVQYNYEQQLHCSSVHRWSWKDRTYELEIFTPQKSLNRKLLHKVCYRITMMSLLDNNRCQHVRLKWFPSACTKRLGNSKTTGSHSHSHSLPCCSHGKPNPPVWNPYQINTGATYRNTCHSVTIWRAEEAGKTFLHEMMHGYGWDFDPPSTQVHSWIRKHFAVAHDIEIRFYEGYVETWATLLNVYMTVMYNAKRSKRLSKQKSSASKASTHQRKQKRNTHRVSRQQAKQHSHIHTLLHTEKDFVLFQVAKVLAHSGFSSWEDFFIDGQRTPTKHFQQNTSVFSYFIVRSAHLWDVQWFVERFRSPDIHRYDNTIATWLDHLLTVYRSVGYSAAINQRMQWFREQSTTADAKGDEMILDTMRMTCVEANA